MKKSKAILLAIIGIAITSIITLSIKYGTKNKVLGIKAETSITDLTGYTWVGNETVTLSGLSLPNAPTSQSESWERNKKIYNLSYRTENYSNSSNVFVINHWSIYLNASNRYEYGLTISDSDYPVIPGYSSNISIYDSGIINTSGTSSTQLLKRNLGYGRKILFTGGTDSTNPTLINWFRTNGTLTNLETEQLQNQITQLQNENAQLQNQLQEIINRSNPTTKIFDNINAFSYTDYPTKTIYEYEVYKTTFNFPFSSNLQNFIGIQIEYATDIDEFWMFYIKNEDLIENGVIIGKQMVDVYNSRDNEWEENAYQRIQVNIMQIDNPTLQFLNKTSFTPKPSEETELLDVKGIMFDILAMPFVFINKAFDITLFAGTSFAINIANLIKDIIALLTILFLIKLFTKGLNAF